MAEVADFGGAPEEIRTPDPQIRSLTVVFEATYELRLVVCSAEHHVRGAYSERTAPSVRYEASRFHGAKMNPYEDHQCEQH